MKALYVVGSCLRCNTSANMSHNGYVQGLIENGFEVDIIMENISFGEVDNAMPVFREANYFEYNSVPFSNKLKNKVKKRVDAPVQQSVQAPPAGAQQENRPVTGRARLRKILKKLYTVFLHRDHPYLLDKKWLKSAARFKSDTLYDVVISNSSPASGHKLVSILKRKNHIKYKKWIQIWEDPWYYDLYATKKKEAVWKEERHLLEQADEIYYVSPLTLENQKKYFKSCAAKMRFIPLPYLVTDRDALEGSNEEQPLQISFGYFGDYYSHVRNLRPFYQALCRSGASGYICGDTNEHFTSTEQVKIFGRLTLEKLNPIQKKTSVLVHLSNVKGGQIPGKIYHYSATNKPILFILDGTAKEQEKIVQYFKPYNRFYFCSNETDAILQTIQKFLQKEIPLQAKPLEDFSPYHVVKTLLWR